MELIRYIRTLVCDRYHVLVSRRLNGIQHINKNNFNVFRQNDILYPTTIKVVNITNRHRRPHPCVLPIIMILRTVRDLRRDLLHRLLNRHLIINRTLRRRGRVPRMRPMGTISIRELDPSCDQYHVPNQYHEHDQECHPNFPMQYDNLPTIRHNDAKSNLHDPQSTTKYRAP